MKIDPVKDRATEAIRTERRIRTRRIRGHHQLAGAIEIAPVIARSCDRNATARINGTTGTACCFIKFVVGDHFGRETRHQSSEQGSQWDIS